MQIFSVSDTRDDGTPIIEFDNYDQSAIVYAGVTLAVSTDGQYVEGPGYVAYSDWDGSRLLNQGTLYAASNFAVVFDSADATITNSAGAMIMGQGGINVASYTTIVNAGSIYATSAPFFALDGEGPYDGVGIRVCDTDASIENTGVISGDVVGIASVYGGAVTLSNSGTIFNGIWFWSPGVEDEPSPGDGADSVHNAGTIFGNVDLGWGDDLYDGRTGFVNGTVYGQDGDDKLLGSAQDDSLDGGANRDRIKGGYGNDDLAGGDGKDILTGGGGRDSFIFENGGAANADRIRDFLSSDDTIQIVANNLEGSFFEALIPLFGTLIDEDGNIVKGMLRFGGQAQDGNDYFIYNADTGVLKYDADADGNGAAQVIARLDPDTKLTYLDIEVSQLILDA